MELKDILASGDIKEIILDDISVAEALRELRGRTWPGLKLPTIDPELAQPQSLFFNPDIARVCFKSESGIVFKLKMQLVD